MQPASFATTRLLLRPFQPADAAQVFQSCQDAQIQRWTTVPSPYTSIHAASYCEQTCPQGWEQGTKFTWAITRREDESRILGSLVVFQRDFVLRSYSGSSVEDGKGTPVGGGQTDIDAGLWEVGYWVSPSHRGQGYLTEALDAVIRWIFFEAPPQLAHQVKSLGWRAEVGNEASRRVILPLGFLLGKTIHNVVFVEGRKPIDIWSATLSRDGFVSARARTGP